MRIGIIVDNPRRDLTGCTVLAAEIAKNGHEAFLIPMYSQNYEVPLLKLDALIVNYLRTTNYELLRYFKKIGIAIFVLDTEAGLLSEEGPRSAKGWATFVAENKLGDVVDGYLFWGKALYEGFLVFSGIPHDKLCLSGTPRYDLSNEKLRNLVKKPSDRYILFNTNFAGVNPKFGKSSAYEIKMAAGAGVKEDLGQKIIADQKLIMDQFIPMALQIAKNNSDIKFILRPHPFEDELPYIKAFEKIDNLKVDGKGEIFEVLQGADLIIHVNCTTALDGYFFDVPSISAEYINTQLMAKYMRVPSLISLTANNLEEINLLIRRSDLLQLQRPKFEKQRELVDSMFGLRDGRSAERVFNFIIDKLNQNKHQPRRSIAGTLSGSSKHIANRKSIIGISNLILGFHGYEKIRSKISPKRLIKAIPVQEINSILSRADDLKTLKIKHPFVIRKLKSIQIYQ
jgi:surface carbohydrate biosynthesis protein